MPHLSPEFSQFLCSAKQATYAAQGDATSVSPALKDTKQLEYREGNYFYRDIYAGMLRFVGQEIVYRDGRAIWSMSYAGGLAQGVAPDSVRAIYTMLRRALLNPMADLPVRGPTLLEHDDMRYTCESSGFLEWFHGFEQISSIGAIVYELRFAGGALE